MSKRKSLKKFSAKVSGGSGKRSNLKSILKQTSSGNNIIKGTKPGKRPVLLKK